METDVNGHDDNIKAVRVITVGDDELSEDTTVGRSGTYVKTIIISMRKRTTIYHQETYATESTANTFDPVFNRKLLAKENCPEYGSAELVGRRLRLLNNTDQEDEQVGIVDEEVLHTMNAEIGNLKNSIHEMLRQMGQFEQSLAWALHKINHTRDLFDLEEQEVVLTYLRAEMTKSVKMEVFSAMTELLVAVRK
ncbi:unnamed protein product [Mytilus coruscus]|uniref:Uncharacterized protein n=1 Tax=Mytilus coruscus TaxID=42192 RepID=A0A6J8DRB4_MYTCO|nr:unnamed protein product [Mytilus coruscus]